jgi:hypothetical protein
MVGPVGAGHGDDTVIDKGKALMIEARALIGTHDVVLITLDTLRYDVARDCLDQGRTPNLAALLPGGHWEERHSPGNFTYAAHHAFFSGFLPTPTAPGRHPRIFAARFPGSETTDQHTFVFDAPDMVTGLAGLGYHTICIGGVGFFNKQSPLGSVLPALFADSYWAPNLGVTDPRSTEHQVRLAREILGGISTERRVFLFLNVSALHQPNYFYLPGALEDGIESHAAALAYVDSNLSPLFAALQARGPALVVCCGDHGTAYGEDGYTGHRVGHSVVWTVPYAEFVLPGRDE